MVVAVERTHEPVVFEEGHALPLVVHISHHHFALQQHLLLLESPLLVASLHLLPRI